MSGTSTSFISQLAAGGPTWPVVKSSAVDLLMTHALSVIP
jgi:hypothetical protein